MTSPVRTELAVDELEITRDERRTKPLPRHTTCGPAPKTSQREMPLKRLKLTRRTLNGQFSDRACQLIGAVSGKHDR